MCKSLINYSGCASYKCNFYLYLKKKIFLLSKKMYLNSILLAVIDIKSMCVENLQNEQIWLEISK